MIKKLPFVMLLSIIVLQHDEARGQFSSRIHEQLRFKYLTIDEGLNDNRVGDLCQDNYGFIWIGTLRGAARYDGYDLKKYNRRLIDTTYADLGDIRNIICDSRNTIWALGTGGICYLDREKDVFVSFIPEGIDAEISLCEAGAEDKSGNLWFGTNMGLINYNINDNSVTAFIHDEENSNSIAAGNIKKICASSKNHIWFSLSQNGAGYLDLETMVFRHYISSSDINSLAENRGERVFEDSYGTIWICHNNNGISQYSYETDNFKRYHPQNGLVGAGRIRGIGEDDKGNLWIGSMKGLYLFNRETETFKRYAYTDHPISTLSHNSILSLLIDNQQGLWLGTYAGGISFTNLNTSGIVKYEYSSIPSNYYLNDKSVYAITFDKYENIWIGTEGGGVNFLDRNTGLFSYLTYNPDDPNSLRSDNIKDIYIDNDEEIAWIATYKGGMSSYDAKSGNFRHYLKSEEFPQGIDDDGIYVLYPDMSNKDIIWVGTSDRLLTFDKKNELFTPITAGNPEYSNTPEFTRVFDITGTSDSKLVFACTGFIAILDCDSKDFEVYESVSGVNISTSDFVFNDRNGDLWAGINSNQLAKINRQNGEFILFDQEDGLPDVDFLKGYDDAEGNIWLSSNMGLWKLENMVDHPDDFEVVHYDVSDNVQSLQFNYHSGTKSPSGEILFGGINGFNSFRGENVKPNPFVPNVVISNLIIGGEEVKVGEKVYGRRILENSILETRDLHFHHKVRVFNFQFSAFHYVAPENNQFRYMLEGYDEDWKYTSSSIRSATYSNIPRGKYVFKVDATNNNGIWSDNPFVVNIKITPPFHKTIVFYGIIAGILALIIYIFIKWRESQLRRDKEILESKIQEGDKELQLRKSEIENQKQALEEKEKAEYEHNWFNEGMARFSDIMSKEKDNLKVLAQNVISNIVEYLEASQGGMYFLNDNDEDNIYLELIANYAYSKEKLQNIKILPGEGLVGSCFKSKVTIINDNIPAGYLKIRSGLGESNPKHLVVIPMILDDDIEGVIELASFSKIEEFKIDFVKKLAGNIVSILLTAKASNRVKEMYQQTQSLAEELQSQEEELRQNMEEMQATAEESARKEAELLDANKKLQEKEQEYLATIEENEKALTLAQKTAAEKDKEIDQLKNDL